MLALPVGQKSWSLTKAVSQWWRGWTTRGSARLELKCRGEDEVERMAKDIGVSASELRRLATLGPDSVDLLLRRMIRRLGSAHIANKYGLQQGDLRDAWPRYQPFSPPRFSPRLRATAV
jgi:hypothetical protein